MADGEVELSLVNTGTWRVKAEAGAPSRPTRETTSGPFTALPLTFKLFVRWY
jgi:hypothetical protein